MSLWEERPGIKHPQNLVYSYIKANYVSPSLPFISLGEAEFEKDIALGGQQSSPDILTDKYQRTEI